MNTWQLATAWQWNVPALAVCVTLLSGYATRIHIRSSRTTVCFLTGVFVLLLTLLSPLELLGSTYLLSAHMVQHLLITQVVAPLLLLGLPSDGAANTVRYASLAQLERVWRRPVVAWLVGIGVVWLWHAPVIYNVALEHPWLLDLQHACVLLAALVFWWPIFAPLPQSRLAALPGILYLFSACLASTVLGIMITFAPSSLYPAYLEPHDTLRLVPFLQGVCGLTPHVDQQVGGLLMWLPCCLLYLVAIVTLYARWQNTLATSLQEGRI